MTKKLLALLMALVMCLSLVPFTVVTAGATETTEHGFTVTKADGTKASGTDIEGSESAPPGVDYYWQGDALFLVKDDLVVSGVGEDGENLFVGCNDYPVSSVTFQGLSTNSAIYLNNLGGELTLTLKGENQIGCDEKKTDYGMILNCKMVVIGDGDLTIFDQYDGILPQGEVTTNTDLTFDKKFTGTLTILDEGETLPEPEPEPPCAISIGNATLTVKGGTLNLFSKNKQAITANSVSIGNGLVVYAGNTAGEIAKRDTYITSGNERIVYIAKPHYENVNESSQEFKPWVDNTALPNIGGNWYLTTDTDLTATWSVPTGTTTNLCLNGHVIKYAGETSGSVINVSSGATLNLYDCNTTTTHDGYIDGNGLWHFGTGGAGTTAKPITGGVITGGRGVSHGGGVKVGGTFNMYGGSITDNKASYGGGVDNNGTFNMYGGAITDNEASELGGGINLNGTFNMYGGEITGNKTADSKNGGGVYANSGTVTLGGSAQITGNVTGGTITASGLTGGAPNNLYLTNGKTITLGTGDSAPKTGMNVGITMQSSAGGKFTTNGTSDQTKYFTPDKAGYSVMYNASGYLELVKTYTVTFDANGHGTAPDPVTNVVSGTTITAPTTPTDTGYTFGGWFKDAACTNAWNFDTDTVTANTTLYAKWTSNSSGRRSGGAVTTVVNMPLIRTGNRGDAVKELQTKLNALGYNCGAVDGIFGSKTYAAVVAFQKAMGISVDGIVGPETWGKLGVTGIIVTTAPAAATSAVSLTISSNMPLITKGSTGDAVKALQTKLNALGYDCGKVDGIFGDKTLAAVKAYQTDKALLVDGKVGNQTWGALR